MLKLDEIKARVNQAENALAKAQRDYERVKHLYKDSVTTLEQLQNSETALNVAKADLEIAEFNLRHARIQAPSSGRVLKQLIDENEMAAAGHPVFLFGKLDRSWKVTAGVTESDVLKLENGDSALVQFDAYPDSPVAGHVSQVSGTLSPATGTFPVEITLYTHLKLKSGFVARVKLLPRTSELLYIVPVKALVDADGMRAFVFSIRNGRAEKNPVHIAFLTDSSAAVQAGLETVSEIITDGAAYLNEGMPVQIEQQAGPEL